MIREILGDLIGCLCLGGLMYGSLYLPLLF